MLFQMATLRLGSTTSVACSIISLAKLYVDSAVWWSSTEMEKLPSSFFRRLQQHKFPGFFQSNP